MWTLSPPAAEPGPPCSQQPFVWVKMWVMCSLWRLNYLTWSRIVCSTSRAAWCLLPTYLVCHMVMVNVSMVPIFCLDQTSFNTLPGNQPNLSYDPSSISHRYWFITLGETSVWTSDKVTCVDLAPSSSKMSQNLSQKWPFDLSDCLPLLRVPHYI